MNKEELVSSIREILGLNLYEARVYLTLVSNDYLDASTIYQKAEIPQPRVYDTLVALQHLGLIDEVTKEKIYYHALTPTTSIKAYLTQLQWDLERKIEIERAKFENRLEVLRTRTNEDITKKQRKSTSLLPVLEEIYVKRPFAAPEVIEKISGQSNVVNHIASEIASSHGTVRNISLPPYAPEALIWENLQQKLKGKLEYMHLANTGLLLEWGLSRIKADIEFGVNFKFLPKSELLHKFYVFDSRACFINFIDPLTNEFSAQGIVIRDLILIKDYQSKFDLAFAKAQDYSELKSLIEEKKELVRPKLNQEEFDTLERIINRGKYATFDGLPSKHRKLILTSLCSKNLIVPFKKAQLGYVSNIAFFLGPKHSF